VDGLTEGADGKVRCAWHGNLDDYLAYHDNEWGRPVDNDIRLFEKICLEGFQSGLSWLTILRKRENFRAGFAGFDFEKVARFGEADVERLVQDAGIIRHRGKITSTINNARRALELRDEFGSLAAYFWAHEPGPEERPGEDWTGTRCARCRNADLDRDLEGSEETRLVLRRADDGLCLHAGHGAGQRPSGRLLVPAGGRGGARRLQEAAMSETPAQALFDRLRALIFETARETEGVGALAESLKWGEPSFAPARPRIGSSVRLAIRDKNTVAMLFICHTHLVDRFREIYPGTFAFEGNRALLFRTDEMLPADETKHCVAMALTWHLARRKKHG
jgi:DNA-3-methyladenine glycosylase I